MNFDRVQSIAEGPGCYRWNNSVRESGARRLDVTVNPAERGTAG
jgi:hypothetical protein